METDYLLLYLQQRATGPCHVPDESSPRHAIPFSTFVLISTLYLLHLCLPYGIFPPDYLTKTLYGFISFLTRARDSAHLILLGLNTLSVNLNVLNTMGKSCPVTCQAGTVGRQRHTTLGIGKDRPR
jgi:hypothetical protein